MAAEEAGAFEGDIRTFSFILLGTRPAFNRAGFFLWAMVGKRWAKLLNLCDILRESEKSKMAQKRRF